MILHAIGSEIEVGEFRQILAWPFVMSGNWENGSAGSESHWYEECNQVLESEGSHWQKKYPRELMKDGSIGAYEEENVFHEYISEKLHRDNHAIRTFQYDSLRQITFKFSREGEGKLKSYNFKTPFNSLRIYDCGVAILTLELEYAGPSLALDEVQYIIHCLRRVNPPYWHGSDTPAHCPLRAIIHEGNSGQEDENREPINLNSRSTRKSEASGFGRPTEIPCELENLKNRENALRALSDTDYKHLLFNWWREILAPLSVEGNLEHDEKPKLRQIMDARIPALTTISLIGEGRPSEVLHSVSDADWFSIAEAVEKSAFGRAGGEFAKKKLDKYLYDRYMPPVVEPSEEESFDVGARFVFAQHHFAAVLAGESGEPNFPELVRRHYRHMQHLCLLEFAAIVGISQRLYQAVNRRNSCKFMLCEWKFRSAILHLQKKFMDFTHRYRFTGVSNDLHIGELFSRFRKSMKLDGMYKETKEELESASNLAFAQRQVKIANSARWLTLFGTIAAILVLLLGFYEVFCKDHMEQPTRVFPANEVDSEI